MVDVHVVTCCLGGPKAQVCRLGAKVGGRLALFCVQHVLFARGGYDPEGLWPGGIRSAVLDSLHAATPARWKAVPLHKRQDRAPQRMTARLYIS